MSAAATTGGARHPDGSFRRSRAARTLVALLAVGSVAVTAAGAHPLGAGTETPPNDVFAVGQGGLGSIDLLALDEADAGGQPGGTSRDGAGRNGTGPSSLRSGAAAGVPVPGAAVAVPGFGADLLASVIQGLPAAPATPEIPAVRAGYGGRAGIPGPTLRAYRAAADVLAREQPGCRIDWALLAGIGHVETGHGRFGGAVVSEQGVSAPGIYGPRLDGSLAGTMVIRDTDGGTLDGDAAYDRAVGPMQFIPGTWKRWGSDGDRDGAAAPQDIDDAALAAARYLCAGTTGLDDPGRAALAVRRYNNSSSYVAQVLALAEGYRSGSMPVAPGLPGGSPSSPPPPGWTLPPGTVVGAGAPVATEPPAAVPSATDPSAGAPTPSSPPSEEPSGVPTEPVPEPSGTPTGEPSSAPSGEPSGSPTSSPSTSEPAPGDTAGSEPAATEPTCGTTSTVEPGGDPALEPCPAPCEASPTGTEPTVEPTATATCLPEPSTTP